MIFIGDILADRGQNDYFTFIVFQKIYRHLNYTILLSNHDIVHLREAEGDDYLSLYPKETHEIFYISYLNFKKLMNRFPELETSAVEMRNTSYKPFITMFEFGYPNSEIVLLFSHTPFLFHDLFFQTDLINCTIFHELKGELEQINDWVKQHIEQNKLHQLKSDILDVAEHRTLGSSLDNEYLSQNHILNIHGHIGQRHTEDILERAINLDDNLGRPKTFATEEVYEGVFSYYCHQQSLQHEQQLSSAQPHSEQLDEVYLTKIFEIVCNLESWSSFDGDSPEIQKLYEKLKSHSKHSELYLLIRQLDDFCRLEQYLELALNCPNPNKVYKIIVLLFEQMEIESEEFLDQLNLTHLFTHDHPSDILSVLMILFNHNFLTAELGNLEQYFFHPNINMLKILLEFYLKERLIDDFEQMEKLFIKSNLRVFIELNKILNKKDCLHNEQKLFINQLLCANQETLAQTYYHLKFMYDHGLITNELLKMTSLEYFSLPELYPLIQLIPNQSPEICLFAFKTLFPMIQRDRTQFHELLKSQDEQIILSEDDWQYILQNPHQFFIILEAKSHHQNKPTHSNHFFSNIQNDEDSQLIKKPKIKQSDKENIYPMQKVGM